MSLPDNLELARSLQDAASTARPSSGAAQSDGGGQGYLALYDVMITDPDLRGATRALYRDGHHARAVEEGFKALIDLVRKRSGLPTDGTPLMEQAFSEKNPRLRINRLRSQADRDEQVGYQRIYAGTVLAIRNPRAHDGNRSDDDVSALRQLVLAEHLIALAKSAIRTRGR